MSKLVMGKKAILEQLKKNNVISVHALTIFPEIYKKCEECNIEYILHNDEYFLRDISANHQGIIAYISDNNYLTENYNEFLSKIPNRKNKLILIMDSLVDQGNVGAIFRTCDALGVDGVIYKKDNQHQINDKTIKASQGSVYNLNILRVTNISQIIDKLKKDGYWIISTSLQNNSININEFSYPNNTCIIVGNEEKGVSQNLINKSDAVVKIPMTGMAQSLNVSVAAGILIYSIKHSS